MDSRIINYFRFLIDNEFSKNSLIFLANQLSIEEMNKLGEYLKDVASSRFLLSLLDNVPASQTFSTLLNYSDCVGKLVSRTK